jgi:hypothetical protein
MFPLEYNVIALTFVGSLPLFFLKSEVDVWFLTGDGRWVWGYQGFIYIDMGVKGLMMIVYKLIYRVSGNSRRRF